MLRNAEMSKKTRERRSLKRIIFTIIVLTFSGSLRAGTRVNQQPHDHEDGSLNFLSNRNFTCRRASAERIRELRGFLLVECFKYLLLKRTLS